MPKRQRPLPTPAPPFDRSLASRPDAEHASDSGLETPTHRSARPTEPALPSLTSRGGAVRRSAAPDGHRVLEANQPLTSQPLHQIVIEPRPATSHPSPPSTWTGSLLWTTRWSWLSCIPGLRDHHHRHRRPGRRPPVVVVASLDAASGAPGLEHSALIGLAVPQVLLQGRHSTLSTAAPPRTRRRWPSPNSLPSDLQGSTAAPVEPNAGRDDRVWMLNQSLGARRQHTLQQPRPTPSSPGRPRQPGCLQSRMVVADAWTPTLVCRIL